MKLQEKEVAFTASSTTTWTEPIGTTVTPPTSVNPKNLVCFSHLRWNFVYQRPQHLLSRASKEWQVWFLEEPVFKEGPIRLEKHEIQSQLCVLVPCMPHGLKPEEVIAQQKRLIDEFIASEGITSYVAWYYTPMALAFSPEVAPELTVYDCMDELSAFLGAPRQLIDLEQRLLQQADVVFTGGHSLYEAKRDKHAHTYAFPSSIDFLHFSQSRKPQPDPDDQRQLAHPRIGFCGVIDERFDIELVRELAQRRPDWQFIFLGPVVKINPASLPKAPNVHYLGMKSYQEIPRYFAHWDAAILPFAICPATRYISPTKTPEYLASGLPVVSTPIHDVIRNYGSRNWVHIADTAERFEAALEQALADKGMTHRKEVDTFLNENSWDRVWNEMAGLMKFHAQPA